MLKKLETVAVVHTHTQCNLINSKESMKSALLNISFYKTDQLIV